MNLKFYHSFYTSTQDLIRHTHPSKRPRLDVFPDLPPTRILPALPATADSPVSLVSSIVIPPVVVILPEAGVGLALVLARVERV